MEKRNSPPLSPRENIIKIKLLDIFPSIKELEQQQNELNIIFQGLDIFYNLYDLLKNKTELTLSPGSKNSIIISLIKSDNIFATSVFHIKQGEQWITFNYENKKKKELSFAQSLIDCIKIRLNCEVNKVNKNIGNLILNSKKINHNNNIKNNYLKQNSNYSSLTTEENSKIPNKIIKTKTEHYFKNISMESSSKEKEKYSCIKSLNNRIKTNKNYSKITYDDLNLQLNKLIDINNIKEESKLNLTQKHKNNNKNNNSNLLKNSSINLSIHNKDNNKLYNKLDLNIIKKSKQIVKNKILKTSTYNSELINKKNKNKIEKNNNFENLYTSNLHISSILTNRNKNDNKKEFKNLENFFNKNNSKTPVITKINSFQNAQKSFKENNILLNQDDIDDNKYEKMKEEFNLLYNDYHIKNIQKDLLKLEIELFLEKMIGLISVYNSEINEKKLNNKIIEKKLKENENKYFRLKKLYYILKLLKEKYKNDLLDKNKMNTKLINIKELEINKKEIDLFNLLYPIKNPNNEEKSNKNNINYINKKEELKSILNIILSKSKNKNIFIKENLNQKLEGIIELNINEEKNKYIKPKTRKRIIPKYQHTQFINKRKINEQLYNKEERKEDYNYNYTEQNSRIENFYISKKA